MSSQALGERMRRYEAVAQYRLVPRSSVIIRVDGRAFHNFLRTARRPFDPDVISAMVAATRATAAEMQGFQLAYTQSDEASFLLGAGAGSPSTDAWYDYGLAKLVSVSASLFTGHFNAAFPDSRLASFDSRAFSVPDDEAPNAFIWRQQDWQRNSLSMFARAHLSHEELLGRSTSEVHDLLHARGENWAHLSDRLKNGTFLAPGGAEVCAKLDYAEISALIAGEG